MSDQELAQQIGSMSVGGEVLTGEALVRYLNLMSSGDKVSMIADLSLLRMLSGTMNDEEDTP